MLSISLLLLVSAFFRFYSYDLPPLMDPDSVKYIVPHAVANNFDFEWIFSNTGGLCFSHLYRSFNFLVQALNGNDLSWSIIIQKLLGLASSLILYFILYHFSKKNIFSLCFALVYSLNPLLLLLEDCLMCEAFFLFFFILSYAFAILMIDVYQNSTRLSLKAIVFSAAFGFSLALIVLTKDLSSFMTTLFIGLGFVSIVELLRNKSALMLKMFIISLAVFFITELPLLVYNHKHFSRWNISAVPLDGGKLWNLNEAIVKRTKAKPEWLSKLLLDLTQRAKQQKSLPLDQDNTEAFNDAVVTITVLGREGKLPNQVTAKLMSPTEFASMVTSYYKQISREEPLYFLDLAARAFQNTFFPKEIQSLNFYVRSSKPGIEYEPYLFLKLPHSNSSLVPPQLEGLKLLELTYLRKDAWYYNANLDTKIPNAIPLHVGRGSGKAFLYDRFNLNAQWINLFRYCPWSTIGFVAWSIALFYFLYRKQFMNYDLKQLFILAIVLMFVFGSITTSGQPRYALFSFSAMLIFIMSVLHTSKNED